MSDPSTSSAVDRSRATFWLAASGTFLAYLDVTIVNIAFPDIAGDFDRAGLGALSWVVNAYALAFAALLVVFGRAADRLGRRRVYLTATAAFAVASTWCAVAPSAGTLIAARAVQGAAAAAMIPAALGLLLAAFPPQRWAPAIAAWGAVGSVAAAFGPPIGGLLDRDRELALDLPHQRAGRPRDRPDRRADAARVARGGDRATGSPRRRAAGGCDRRAGARAGAGCVVGLDVGRDARGVRHRGRRRDGARAADAPDRGAGARAVAAAHRAGRGPRTPARWRSAPRCSPASCARCCS